MFALPANYRLEIVATPPVLESTIEAAYYPAPPFKASGIGRFYLTASHGDVGVLKENNVHSVADLCAHEGFPGHDWHYQFMRSRSRSISGVRWLTPGEVEGSSSMWADSMATEGWALYAEQLMGEPRAGSPGGFYTPEERIYQLKGQLLRAARVRIDTGLHTERMTFDEAVGYLTANVDLLPGACDPGGSVNRLAAPSTGIRSGRRRRSPTILESGRSSTSAIGSRRSRATASRSANSTSASYRSARSRSATFEIVSWMRSGNAEAGDGTSQEDSSGCRGGRGGGAAGRSIVRVAARSGDRGPAPRAGSSRSAASASRANSRSMPTLSERSP